MPVLKQMKADCLNVQVFDTRDAMGCAAGECACATIRELLEKKITYMSYLRLPHLRAKC